MKYHCLSAFVGIYKMRITVDGRALMKEKRLHFLPQRVSYGVYKEDFFLIHLFSVRLRE